MIVKRYVNRPGWNFPGSFSDFDRLQKEMDILSDRLMERDLGRKAGVFPLINLTEDNDNYYLRAELPGVNNEEIEIEATGTTLSLSGERKIPAENEDSKYHRREREAGKFSRMVSLATEIDSDMIEANLTNGILKVLLPKAEKAKPRKITLS